eukprot:1160336-Pelagomonas_calceolata.AAC.1
MTPEPSLSHRFSAMSSTSGKDIGSTDGFSFGADEILERQGVRGGGKQDGVLQGTGGKRGTASNSSNSNSSAVAQGKQRLTLSEMGMLHGAWPAGLCWSTGLGMPTRLSRSMQAYRARFKDLTYAGLRGLAKPQVQALLCSHPLISEMKNREGELACIWATGVASLHALYGVQWR